MIRMAIKKNREWTFIFDSGFSITCKDWPTFLFLANYFRCIGEVSAKSDYPN